MLDRGTREGAAGSVTTCAAHASSAARFSSANEYFWYTLTIPRKLPEAWFKSFSTVSIRTPSAAMPLAQDRLKS
jgi:hypothetical protein